MVRSLLVSPSTVSRECLCLGLKRAARAVSRRYDEALRPLDRNSGQFSILTAIAGVHHKGTGMTLGRTPGITPDICRRKFASQQSNFGDRAGGV